MGRIEKKFTELRTGNKKALIVYITAGDPSIEVTKQILPVLEKAGADIIEVGVPFSDPTADGPVIQAASQRALKAGTTLQDVLAMIGEVRRTSQIPFVLFGYFNPIFTYGMERFARDAAQAGVDGILVVDLPPEEADVLRSHTDPAGLDFISLVAPTTGPERLKKIVRGATGFVYYISITGVTGTAAPEVQDIRREVGKIRKYTDMPVAVGFGISTAALAGQIGSLADGVVIGSSVVRLIEAHGHSQGLMPAISDYITEMKAALG